MSLAEELALAGQIPRPVVLVLGASHRGKRTFVNWYLRDLVIPSSSSKAVSPLLVSNDPPRPLRDITTVPSKNNSKLSFLIIDDPERNELAYAKHCHIALVFLEADDDISYLPLAPPARYFVPKADTKKQSQRVTEVGQVNNRLSEKLKGFESVESIGLASCKTGDNLGFLLEDLPTPHELTWKGATIIRPQASLRRKHYSLDAAKQAADEANDLALVTCYDSYIASLRLQRHMFPFLGGVPAACMAVYSMIAAGIGIVIWLCVIVFLEQDYRNRVKYGQRLQDLFDKMEKQKQPKS